MPSVWLPTTYQNTSKHCCTQLIRLALFLTLLSSFKFIFRDLEVAASAPEQPAVDVESYSAVSDYSAGQKRAADDEDKVFMLDQP